ncbi:hypothetical protein [Arhodomonas sp. AD133]|uniref:hypothetical protein n=1 Tax=Arhodomonas sp. AD133 TaxID=3415009 RepID=UPI003EBCA9BD
MPLCVAGGVFGLSVVSVEVLAPGPGWVSDAQQTRSVERERLRRLDPVYEDYVHVPMDDASDRWARMAEYASARGFHPDARAFAERALKSDDSNVRVWGALLEVFRASRNRSGVEWLVQEISRLQVHSEHDRIALRRIHGRALDALAAWE